MRHHDRVQPASGTVGSPLPSRSRLLVHCAKMGATPNDTTRTLFCACTIADEGSGESRARQRIRFARGAHRARHYDDPHGKDYLLASWTKGLSTLVRPLGDRRLRQHPVLQGAERLAGHGTGASIQERRALYFEPLVSADVTFTFLPTDRRVFREHRTIGTGTRAR